MMKINEIIVQENIKLAPAVISGLDFEVANNNLQEYLKPYKNLALNDENVKEVTKARAELNKLSKAFNDIKIKLTKEANVTVDQIKDEFKKLIEVVNSESKNLDVQIKEYEEKQKKIKEDELNKLIEESIKYTEIDASEITISDKWFLKGTKEAEIKEDIQEQIIIQNTKRTIIKQFVKTANKTLKNNSMNEEKYNKDLNKNLNEISEILNRDLEILEESERIQNEINRVLDRDIEILEESKKIQNENKTKTDDVIKIELEVKEPDTLKTIRAYPKNFDELNKLEMFLCDNNISYEIQ